MAFGGKPWTRGQSGNPSGRRALSAPEKRAIEHARKLCPEAMQELGAMMRDSELRPECRLKVIQVILDRGLGRPVQQVEYRDADAPERTRAEQLELLRGAVAALERDEAAAREGLQ